MHEWWEYHLTPRGWEEGSEKSHSGGDVLRPPPHDRVKTVLYHALVSSGTRKIDRWLETLFKAPPLQRAFLEKKFGDVPPQHQDVSDRKNS